MRLLLLAFRCRRGVNIHLRAVKFSKFFPGVIPRPEPPLQEKGNGRKREGKIVHNPIKILATPLSVKFSALLTNIPTYRVL
jgi:hypothetical protein